MGACTFDLIYDYDSELEPGAILEIGSTRGEGSTYFFAGYTANQSKYRFITVDRNPELTRHLCKLERLGDIKVFTMTGEDFVDKVLPSADYKLSYVYLDGFDIIREYQELDPFIVDQKEQYQQQFKVELSNENSWESHLYIAKGLIEYTTKNCIIHIDDTWYDETLGWQGKGATAVPFLLENSWQLLPEPEIPFFGTGYVALRKLNNG